MLINQAFNQVIDAITRGQQPEAEALHEVLNDAGLRRRLLNERAAAAALAQAAAERSGVSCADVEAELPLLIDAEQSGTMLDLLAPVQSHVQVCPACMDLYSASRWLDQAQTTGQAPQWPKLPHVPSLAIPPSIVPLVVPGGDIQHAIRHASQRRGMRGGVPVGSMLYAGPIPGHRDLFIDIQLAHALDDAAEPQALRVQLQGAATIGNRTVTLQRDSEIRSGRTDSTGQALITDIPAAWLSAEACDLLIFIGPG